jgi:hypothetical protein
VRKTLATVLPIWCLHVILLSKVSPRYIIYKGIVSSVICNMSWGISSPEFPLHLSLCSTAHTTALLQWGRVAVYREHDFRASLSCKYRYRPRTKQNEFQVTRGNHLCIEQHWGKEITLRHPAAISLGVNNRLLQRLNFLSQERSNWLNKTRLKF